MVLVSMSGMLRAARAGGYAVGQFNIYGLHWIRAALRTAEELRSPIILAASERIVDDLGGYRTIAVMAEEQVRAMKITVPVALHLDHGTSVESCIRAIDAGFTSVMIDGSHHPIEENIAMTRDVVAHARPRGVSVEAEVGTVGGMEDGMIGGIRYADPEECRRLVEETGVDALAAALGSVHGPYQGEPKLGFAEMKVISGLTQVPLVLHGGSGIPDEQIRKCIALGHAKINVNTDCLQAWAGALRETLAAKPEVYDPRAILAPPEQAIADTVKAKITLFGSAGRA
jgi:6-phospho-5-dehydro-2-deoxy-D-gluconate aldolase